MLDERGDGSLKTYLSWYQALHASKSGPGNYGYTVPCELADAAYNDNWVGGNALSLLESEFAGDHPWFLQVNFPGPHNPEDITRTMAGWYPDTPFPQPIANDQLAPEVHVRIRRNYSAMVENIDRWLGRFLESLERRGQLDRTLVVFASDHGEMLGDHDRWGKTMPYEASASVPLIVRGLGVTPGKVHSGVASTLDLSATFLDFAGVSVPADMYSRSLRPVLTGTEKTGRTHVTSALGPWRLVCDGRYKLIRGFDPASRMEGEGLATAEAPADLPPLLFDLEADPGERENVADRHPEIVSRLTARLPRTA
jgi:arylsulfatase A-like enzyme